MRVFLEIPGKVCDLAKAILTLVQFEHNMVSRQPLTPLTIFNGAGY